MNIATALPIAYWSMHDGYGGTGGGWWVWMMLMMVLFLGAIIVGAVWLARNTTAGPASPHRQTPSEILDERFAEGALSADEYRARKDALTGAGPTHDGA